MYEIKSLSIVCLFSDILHSTSLSVPHTHHLLQQVHTNFCPEGKRDAAFTSDYCKKINFKSWKKIAVHVFSVEHNRMNKISFRKVCEWCGWMVLAPLMTCADLPAGLRGGQWGCLPLVYEGSWLMNMAPCQCQVREGGGESSESGGWGKSQETEENAEGRWPMAPLLCCTNERTTCVIRCHIENITETFPWSSGQDSVS